MKFDIQNPSLANFLFMKIIGQKLKVDIRDYFSYGYPIRYNDIIIGQLNRGDNLGLLTMTIKVNLFGQTYSTEPFSPIETPGINLGAILNNFINKLGLTQ